MTETKLCKDCRHCMPEKKVEYYGLFYLRKRTVLNYRFAKCNRTADFDGSEFVDGLPQISYSYCTTQRVVKSDTSCSPEAKFFEPI